MLLSFPIPIYVCNYLCWVASILTKRYVQAASRHTNHGGFTRQFNFGAMTWLWYGLPTENPWISSKNQYQHREMKNWYAEIFAQIIRFTIPQINKEPATWDGGVGRLHSDTKGHHMWFSSSRYYVIGWYINNININPAYEKQNMSALYFI